MGLYLEKLKDISWDCILKSTEPTDDAIFIQKVWLTEEQKNNLRTLPPEEVG